MATQITVNGRRTVWCQQHDPLSLLPTSARNYEMPSAAAAESATVLSFLMRQSAPNAATVAAIRAAVAWFQSTKIPDVTFRSTGAGGRRLIVTPGAGPLWARCYDLTTGRPIFGDRDRRIYDRVEEISEERRNGYSWYNDAPAMALAIILLPASVRTLARVFAVAGIYVAVEETLEDSLCAELVGAEHHGIAFGTLATVNGAGDFLSRLVVGGLWTWVGTGAAFGYCALLFLAGAWLVGRLRATGDPALTRA